MAPRGRPEVFDGSRRAAEIEHVGHVTAGVAGSRRREDTPGQIRARDKDVVCVCDRREKGLCFPFPCRLRGTASHCTEGCDRKIRGAGCQEGGSRLDVWMEVVLGPRDSSAGLGPAVEESRASWGVRSRNRTRWAVKVLLACKRRALEGTYGGRSSSSNVTRDGFQKTPS
jgi:hypothetical protein